MSDLNDSPKEECGIIGIFAPNEDVARMTFFGLFALQHRGQESAGVASSNAKEIFCYKAMGHVADIFTASVLNQLPGHMAIGHTRYSTTGSSLIRNAQPFMIETMNGPLALAHARAGAQARARNRAGRADRPAAGRGRRRGWHAGPGLAAALRPPN